MGCGHSKINIYPRRHRAKSSTKKTVTPEKAEEKEEESIESESDTSENQEDCDQRKTIKVKPFGGPLLAQTEISTSQQDFFRMLDEKIRSGPDYDAESETEKALEAARLSALLKDWETASVGSRSLPVTPIRRAKFPISEKSRPDSVRSMEAGREISRITHIERVYGSPVPQAIIHQNYGVNHILYRPPMNQPTYISQNQSQTIPQQLPQVSYPPALQYQALSPMYSTQSTFQPTSRQYPNYNQRGSPIRTYPNNSPKHIPYDQPIAYSPGHKLYGPSIPNPNVQSFGKPVYSNGELQMYGQQQYKDAREQVIGPQHQSYRIARSYQSSVTIPIVVQSQQNEMNALARKQYELT